MVRAKNWENDRTIAGGFSSKPWSWWHQRVLNGLGNHIWPLETAAIGSPWVTLDLDVAFFFVSSHWFWNQVRKNMVHNIDLVICILTQIMFEREFTWNHVGAQFPIKSGFPPEICVFFSGQTVGLLMSIQKTSQKLGFYNQNMGVSERGGCP